MSLSTFSSEPETDPRPVFLRILVAIALTMTVALGLVRLFTHLNDASGETFLARVLEARAALPRIVKEEQDLMLFYGSSMVQAGFSPRQFDQDMAGRGIGVKSFNFGFGGLNPYFQMYLARRITEPLIASNRRLKLVLIEFNPFQTTKTRRNRALSIEDSFLGLLASPEELWQLTLQDPKRGIRVHTIRYLRDGVSSEMITTFFGGAFRPPRPKTALQTDEAADRQLREVGQKLQAKFKEEYPDYVESEWSYEWQGGGTLPEERSEDTHALVAQFYEAQQAPHRMDDDRLFRVHTADIIDLDFDEVLVASFIDAVKTFQQVSDLVEVVLLPKNTDWIKNPPNALARQHAVIARIARETGVPVHNFQQIPAVTNDMFSDTTHLNRYRGAVAFTTFIAERYADALR